MAKVLKLRDLLSGRCLKEKQSVSLQKDEKFRILTHTKDTLVPHRPSPFSWLASVPWPCSGAMEQEGWSEGINIPQMSDGVNPPKSTEGSYSI